MADVSTLEQTEITKGPIDESEELEKIKARAKKTLKDWKGREPEKVAEYLSTLANNRDNEDITTLLVGVLNEIKGMPPEEKINLINKSCDKVNSGKGYTEARTPGDQGEPITPDKYYELLKKLQQQELAQKIQTQFKQPLKVKATPKPRTN